MSQILLAIVILLPALVFSDTHDFYFRAGHMEVNATKLSRAPGLAEIDDKHVTIDGTATKAGEFVDYGFELQITSIHHSTQDAFSAKAACTTMYWKGQYMYHLEGSIAIVGAGESMNFTGYCKSTEDGTKISVNFVARSNGCFRFPPVEGAQMARSLIGTKDISAGAVLGYSVIGTISPYATCSHFSTYKVVSEVKPGLLILAKNKKYCAVVDKEGDKFISMDPKTGKVKLTPMIYVKQYFPEGYEFQDYSC